MTTPICGLKLSHDGALAVVEDGRLSLCIEAEKVQNNRRHAPMNDVAVIVDQLAMHDISVNDVAVAIDGWARVPDGSPKVEIRDASGESQWLDVAGYNDKDDSRLASDLRACITGKLTLGQGDHPFRSYLHATGHALAGYCTSPAATRQESSLILVWDGGMPATLYSFDPNKRELIGLGTALEVSGALYPIFASQFKPFEVSTARGPERNSRFKGVAEAFLPISGKAMAYAGLSDPSPEAIEILEGLTRKFTPRDTQRSVLWSRRAFRRLKPLGLSDAEALSSFQEFLCRALLRGLKSKVETVAGRASLCFVGGCALNIKWNAALRSSGLFDWVWVPPFPNDSGSAIGAACAEMLKTTPHTAIDWTVFAGPAVGATTEPVPGWEVTAAEIEEVAPIVHSGEPVVILAGRSEVGPRALGRRSIIAPATSPRMRDQLNRIKHREWYRPVAPICLEERAPEVFEPGSKDPYMLFDHSVRPNWVERIPAVVHADGSARLQTVGRDNEVMRRLLVSYELLSGLPVLCNTSANFPGCGFFPDAASAMRWGGVRHVWCDGRLFTQNVREQEAADTA